MSQLRMPGHVVGPLLVLEKLLAHEEHRDALGAQTRHVAPSATRFAPIGVDDEM
jgi:hypothetical protein